MNLFRKYPQFLIVGIICLLATLYFYYVFKPIPALKPKTNTTDSIKELKRLEEENLRIKFKLEIEEKVIDRMAKKIDSLELVKSKIHIKYAIKYKEVDSSNSSAIRAKFDSIFTVHNIK